MSGIQRGWVYVGGNAFASDKAGEPNQSPAALRVLAATAGQEVVFTAVPVGTGTRIGVNRDEDSLLDGDDNCPGVPNDPQTDTDGDGIGDPCDPTPLPEPGLVGSLMLALPMLRWMGRRRRRA
jgi:hypothetical protein